MRILMYVRSIIPGFKTDEEAVKAALATLEEKLDVYEKILSKQKFLAGDVSDNSHTSVHTSLIHDALGNNAR